MLVVHKFKEAIRQTLYAFEKNEGSFIRLEDAKAIVEIRKLFDNHDMGATELWISLTEIVFTIHGKFFSILPFVNDLKSNLLLVLARKEFEYKNFSQEEIKTLRKTVTELQQRTPSDIVTDKYVLREEYQREMNKILAQLRDSKIKDTAEIEELRQALIAEREKNEKLVAALNSEKQRAANAESQLDHLNLKLLEKNQEIEILKQEIDQLKSKMMVAEGNDTLSLKQHASPSFKLKFYQSAL